MARQCSSVRVRAERAGFSYSDAVTVLRDATFTLERGWSALVGENGAGKSTLLRLIAGELEPSEGRLVVEPTAARLLVCAQDVALDPAKLEDFAFVRQAGALRSVLHLEASQLTRAPTLSPGERKRWQLGAALFDEPDVLLLDEPTNHLDREARQWLIAALRDFRGVGLIVSHDRALLDALARQTLRLQRARLHAHPGNYSQAREAWQAERREQIAEHALAQRERKRQQRMLDRLQRDQRAASLDRNAGRRMKNKYDSDARSLVAQVAREWASKSLGKRVAASQTQLGRAERSAAELVIDKELGRSVFVRYERATRRILLDGLDVLELPQGRLESVPLLRRDARVCLRGPNGSGKTTLLRALLAHSSLPRDRYLYPPQTFTPAEEQKALDGVRELESGARGRLLSIVAALGVDPDRLLASAHPSPGEARKLWIARGLSEQRWLLVLDEPENHLDLPSIERLELALRSYPGALLLVSHDAAFASACVDTTWDLRDGSLRVAPLTAAEAN